MEILLVVDDNKDFHKYINNHIFILENNIDFSSDKGFDDLKLFLFIYLFKK